MFLQGFFTQLLLSFYFIFFLTHHKIYLLFDLFVTDCVIWKINIKKIYIYVCTHIGIGKILFTEFDVDALYYIIYEIATKS